MPATIICFTWPTASPRRKIELTITAAALKSRLRQKLTQAVAPIAKSARPTSNWKGLDLPADVRRRDLGKEQMEDRRPEARHADGQEQDPPQQAIWAWRAGSPRRRERQRRHEQKHRQVAQDESDRFGHHGLLRRTGGDLDRGLAAR